MNAPTETLDSLKQQLVQMQELHRSGVLSDAHFEEGRTKLERRILDRVMAGDAPTGTVALAQTAAPAAAPVHARAAAAAYAATAAASPVCKPVRWTHSPAMLTGWRLAPPTCTPIFRTARIWA